MIANEQNLKNIFLNDTNLWRSIFGEYMFNEEVPNFSIYRKPYDSNIVS